MKCVSWQAKRTKIGLAIEVLTQFREGKKKGESVLCGGSCGQEEGCWEDNLSMQCCACNQSRDFSMHTA